MPGIFSVVSPEYTRFCKRCNIEFKTNDDRKIYCCNQHAKNGLMSPRVPFAAIKPDNEIVSFKVKKAMRNRVGERDNWICQICQFPINKTLIWPHPLCPVGDHYPIMCCDGGKASMANLRIAHSICNGSHLPQHSSVPITKDECALYNQIANALGWNKWIKHGKQITKRNKCEGCPILQFKELENA